MGRMASLTLAQLGELRRSMAALKEIFDPDGTEQTTKES
jgi:hypothetical protein